MRRETEAVLGEVLARLLPQLDERQRRLALGAAARVVGYGGIRRVARVAGVAESTVARGARELVVGGQGPGRVRAAGAGRKRLRDRDPGLIPALLALVEPDQRGDPQSPLRWTTKSTRNLAAELTLQGHPVSADTVAALLKAEGFSLQACGCRIFSPHHATCAYSWINPPSRSRRTTLPGDARTTGWLGPSGGACPRARCGRWRL
jgi:hypothetical protein